MPCQARERSALAWAHASGPHGLDTRDRPGSGSIRPVGTVDASGEAGPLGRRGSGTDSTARDRRPWPGPGLDDSVRFLAAGSPAMDEPLALGDLACSHCGEDLGDAGYVPARTGNDDREPVPGGALCTACGFSEVGFAGCAPDPGDVEVEADALLHVERGGDGYEVLGVKE